MTSSSPPQIIRIGRDDDSVRAYLDRFKAFRLLSLQLAPEAFLSTYAREEAFTDETWYGRLANPNAAVFAALQSDRLISVLAILGPLPYRPEDLSPLGNPWTALGADAASKEPTQSHWRINGLFTLPEARGKGIAQVLIETALKFASAEAAAAEKDFAGTVAVDSDNIAAKALYEKCGFVVIKEDVLRGGHERTVLLLKYSSSAP